jgi:hypothetical protein
LSLYVELGRICGGLSYPAENMQIFKCRTLSPTMARRFLRCPLQAVNVPGGRKGGSINAATQAQKFQKEIFLFGIYPGMKLPFDLLTDSEIPPIHTHKL